MHDYAQLEPEGPLPRVGPGLIRYGDALLLKTPYKSAQGSVEVYDCQTGRQHALSNLRPAQQASIMVIPLKRVSI